MNERKKCFIITPIGSDDSLIRRHADGVIDAVIEPILEQMDYEVTVAHRMSEGGSITRQVIQSVINSDLVVANLTGLNPNVMYELAIRHAIRKPLVQICELGCSLPFDISEQRTIFYTNDMKGTVELKDSFERMVQKAIIDENPDNPIYRAIQSDIIIHKTDITDTEKYLINRIDQLEEKIINAVSKYSPRNTNDNKKEFSSRLLTPMDMDLAKTFIADSLAKGDTINPLVLMDYFESLGISVSRAVAGKLLNEIIKKEKIPIGQTQNIF
jgi:hypothetical protein